MLQCAATLKWESQISQVYSDWEWLQVWLWCEKDWFTLIRMSEHCFVKDILLCHISLWYNSVQLSRWHSGIWLTDIIFFLSLSLSLSVTCSNFQWSTLFQQLALLPSSGKEYTWSSAALRWGYLQAVGRVPKESRLCQWYLNVQGGARNVIPFYYPINPLPALTL
jgi:hypothetical protein